MKGHGAVPVSRSKVEKVKGVTEDGVKITQQSSC